MTEQEAPKPGTLAYARARAEADGSLDGEEDGYDGPFPRVVEAAPSDTNWEALLVRIQREMESYDPETLGDDPTVFDSWKLLYDLKAALESSSQPVQVEVTDEPTVDEWRAAMDAERARQIEKGYDDKHDREHGVAHLLSWAIDYARRGKSVESATMIRQALEMLNRTEVAP